MKILGIKLKNINSLHGEWEIRFDRPPLSDTRIFAIVGPNGSGKSSILDGLTLALYGETSRLRSPESGIVHWRADDSYSEVTFSVDEKLYRSRWSVRKTNGSLESPEMSLISLNGGETVLEDRVVRVRDRIAELTGLDFKRFCCSILLAQGHFTAFLQALENERAEILEKIIGTEAAQELEESIRSRAAIESERLDQLRKTAESFPFPGGDRLEEARQVCEKTREELREAGRTLEELQTLEVRLERLERLEAAEHDGTKALEEAKARHADADSELQNLERARSVRPFAESIKDLESLKLQAETDQSLLVRLQEEVPATEARIHEIEELLRQSLAELDQARREIEERDEELTSAARSDRDIAAEQDRFLGEVSRYEDVQRSIKRALQQQTEIDQRIVEIEIRRKELLAWLEEHDRDGSLREKMDLIDTILSRISAVRNQLDDCRSRKSTTLDAVGRTEKELRKAELATEKLQGKVSVLAMRKGDCDSRLKQLLGNRASESLRDEIGAVKQKVSACKKLIKVGKRYLKLTANGDPEGELARITAERDALSRALADEKASFAAFEEKVRWRDLLAHYNESRLELKAGMHCPLCGALDHPFAEKGLPDFSELDRVLQEHEQKMSALREEMAALDTAAAPLKKQAEAAGKVREEWAKLRLRAGGEWDTGDVGPVREEIRSLKADIKDLKSRARRARWQKWWAAWIGGSLRKGTKKLTAQEQIRNDFRDEHEAHRRTLADLRSRMERLEEEERTARAELAALLQTCGEPSPGTGMETDRARLLKMRAQTYQGRLAGRTALEEQHRSFVAQREALLEELKGLQEQADTLDAEIRSAQTRLSTMQTERKRRFGDLDPLGDRQALESRIDTLTTRHTALNGEMEALRERLEEDRSSLAQLPDQIHTMRQSIADSEQELLDRTAPSGFGALDELKRALSLLQDEQRVIERSAAAENTLAEAEFQAEAARRALEAARFEHEEDDTLENVAGKIVDTKQRQETLQRMIDDAECTLLQHGDLEREYREILQAVAVQEKICAEATAERKILQSQGPAQIRRELQRLLMERLIEQTNQHLSVLTGRYSLQLSADNSLSIQVDDPLQGTSSRAIDNLSGGESFVVSLCLALGLSEMAGKHRKVESLFLDEGFGTLDDEMLYAVLSALKGLRDSGKTVGVISHVKRLADEIPTQIRVEKQPDGLSRISIVA